MEKVKLTMEQADLLEREKEAGFEKYETVKRFLGIYGVHGRDFHLDELIKALYIGYEVEETFEVGEWVVLTRVPDGAETDTYKITSINEGYVYLDNIYGQFRVEKIRHATPEEIAEEKQRRWWAKHGREVWELREGDCLISKHDKHSCQVKFVEAGDETGVLLVDGIQDEFYEGEHGLQIMRDKYEVFCFAEDRKDIKQ